MNARPGPRPSRLPFPLLRKLAFWGYAAALLTATHWPRLKIDVEGIERPDLLIHLAAFGLWTFLLTCSGYLGYPERTSTAARALLLGLIFAAIDEGSQALPFLHRQVALDDYLANAAGVTLGAGAALVFSRLVIRFLAPHLRQTPKP